MVFSFFKKKEKQFPKIIIFCGMMGVGKTTLVKKLFNILKFHNFETSNENYGNKPHTDFEVINKDYKRVKELVKCLRDSNSDKKIISDGFLLNTLFLNILTKEPDLNKVQMEVLDKFEFLFKKFNLSEIELNNILFLHVTNKKGFFQYSNREGNYADFNEKNYHRLKFRYNIIIKSILKVIKRNHNVNYKKVNITRLNINSENEIKKFIENNLLIDK